MNKRQQVLLLGRCSLPLRILICVCLIGLFTGIGGTLSAYAASSVSDPLVVVAIDATPSTCTITHKMIRPRKTIPQSTLITSTHCPAGTAISITEMHLSQAKALHDAYVVYPASPQQIQELTQAKRAAFQSTQNSSVHPATCLGGGYEETDINPTWNGDYLYMAVFYDVAPDCSSIFLDQEDVEGFNPVPTADFWIASYYWGYNGYCASAVQNGSDFIGNYDRVVYVDATEPPNKSNLWDIAANSCSGSPGAYTTYSAEVSVF